MLPGHSRINAPHLPCWCSKQLIQPCQQRRTFNPISGKSLLPSLLLSQANRPVPLHWTFHVMMAR